MSIRRIFTLVAAASFIAALSACKVSKDEKSAKPVEPKEGGEPPAQVEKPATERISGPIAKVNGVAIDSEQFYENMDKITQGGARNIPEARLGKIRRNIMNRLIEEELMKQEIAKQKVEVTEDELDAEFDRYKARFKSDQQFENYLKHGRTSIEAIKERLKQSAALGKLLSKLGKLDVSDEDVKKAYETGIRMYTEPEQAHALHILIKVPENAPEEEVAEAKKKIGEALKKVRKGADFAETAKEYSDDTMSAKKGGDLGFFRRGVMVPAFEKVAFDLKPGQITKKPVRTPFGFHIIKLLEHKDKRIKPIDEVQEQIKSSLKNRNTFKARRELVKRLKTEADIERFIEESEEK